MTARNAASTERLGKRHVVNKRVQVPEKVMVREDTRSGSSPSTPLLSLLQRGGSLPEPRGKCVVGAFHLGPKYQC